ncbi:MAG: tetratricopeptide repeat protein, partial [Candidatus Zixiibacteriota bacterium]
YVLCYVKLSLREYAAAVEVAEKYIALRENIRQGKNRPRLFCSTGAQAAQLYNFLGVACREKNDMPAAIEAYRQAIAIDPGNHLPYLNLANLYIQQVQINLAREIVAQGLKKSRQIQELRMLADSFDKRVSVSACLMVKDEEELLPGCLDSVRDWVEEIIVVDTGSSDRTVEIARSYGAKIFHQPWEGNFSKHRNYSIEQATSDWIFIIDADERLCREDVPQLLRLLRQSASPVIAINVYNLYRDKNQSVTFLPSERFFKRNLNLRYHGIVHNQLKIPPDIPILRAGIKLQHLGYDLSPDKMAKKMARSRALLEKQLEENPDNTFALFNLAQLHRSGSHGFDLENAPLVLKWAGRAVALTDPTKREERHLHLMCLDQLAWTHFYLKEYNRALEYGQRALKIKPDYLDPLLLLGHIYCQMREFETAFKCYREYLEVQARFDEARETEPIILLHVDSRANAFYSMGVMAEMSGDLVQAKEYYQETLKVNPDFLEANTLLGNILLKENNLAEAEKYFRRHLETGNKIKDAALQLAFIKQQQKDFDGAARYYQRVLDEYPEDREVLTRYGEFCLEAGHDAQAVKLFQKAAGQGEPTVNLEKKLAKTYLKTGRYNEAIELYRQLLQRHKETAEFLYDLGNCYYKTDNFAEAEQYYLKTLEIEPGMADAYRNLGLARARQNRPREAIVALERFIELNPNQHEILHIIGDLYGKLGEYDSAINYFERFLGFKPHDSLALFNLSECYLHMGHKDSAVMGYRRILEIDPGFKPARHRLYSLEDVMEKA